MYMSNSFDILDRISPTSSFRDKRLSKFHQDELLPQNFQADLVSLCENSNRILFLPLEKDKFHVSILLVKQFASELLRTGTRIIYFVDSTVNADSITNLLRKNAPLNVSSYIKTSDEENWHKFVANNNVLIIACQPYSMLPYSLEHIISISKLIIFDDCIYGLNDNSMKQVITSILRYGIPSSSNILGLTSILVGGVFVQDVYRYLIQLEKTFQSSIITSHYCNSVKKYLTRTTIKLNKFTPCSTNHDFNEIETIINNLNFITRNYKYNEDEEFIKNELKLILNEFLKLLSSSAIYPIFIIANIYRIKLENLRLRILGTRLFSVISSIISDFNIINMLLMQLIGCLNDVQNLAKKCGNKIEKLLSILIKMKYESNCIIIVQNRVAAQVLTYIIQQFSSIDGNFSHTRAELLVDDTSRDLSTDREKLFNKKKFRAVLKEFREVRINVLVLSWESLFNVPGLTADWIIYFDLPVNFAAYVASQKYGNTRENEHYFLLEESNSGNLKEKLEPYAQLNWDMKEVIQNKDVTSLENFTRGCRNQANHTTELNSSPLITSSNAEANLLNAISIIKKYCEYLPGDAFSPVSIRWTIKKEREGIACRLVFPIQCGVKTAIEIIMPNDTKQIKQMVALKAVKILFENKHLDDNLNPTVHKLNAEIINDKTLFPHWREEDEVIKPGSSNCYRLTPIAFPVWFHDGAPKAGCDAYVHIIHLKPAYPEPDVSRKKVFHELLFSNCDFGIVTSNRLPEMCQFPIFADLGEIRVTIEVNAYIVKLTVEQIEKLFSFHRFLFVQILQVVKGFLISDRSLKENAYCIVPVKPSGINWEVVNELSVKHEIVRPSDEYRLTTDYMNTEYTGKIVTPWYRELLQRYYVVTNVLKTCTPNSTFSSREYESFSEYYYDKYELEVKQPTQPLLQARAITSNFNFTRPRAQNPGIRRKRGEKEMDFEETLIPELCILQSFPAAYWYKSITLLTIMHRLNFILLAEMIRRRVASGTIESEILSNSLLLDPDDVLTPDINCTHELEELTKPVIPISAILKDVKLTKKMRSYPWASEPLPEDTNRMLDKTSILKLMVHHDFMRKNTVLPTRSQYDEFDGMCSNNPISLRFLKLSRSLCPGPKQKNILQALTLPQCGDIINLEYFKLVGNSFLKFATSLMLCKLYPNLNFLQLKRIRRRLIGKRNLFYCGSRLELASFLKVQDLSANNDWNFGGFCVPEMLVNVVINSAVPPEVIFNLEIPRDEQISGIISAETRNILQEKMLSYYDEITKEDVNFLNSDAHSYDNNHVLHYFQKQSIPDKAVVDALKALTGVYVMDCGVQAGFKFLQFVGIVKSDVSMKEFLINTFQTTNCDKLNDFTCLSKIYSVTGYTFKCKQLPVQVFTHHSCFTEPYRECNRKLAFLGESILDLLITSFIHENCGVLSTTDTEDIRVALVNDILFSVIVVRHGLHKFLFIESPFLIEKIDKFVSQQERVGHVMDNNEFLFLIEETTRHNNESVDVPKALSDTFKALIGAIFVDSEGDLELVWSICYSIFSNEIDSFMNLIPRNPVKLLSETDIPIEYEQPTVYKRDIDLLEVKMRVNIDRTTRSFTGIGSTRHEATRIAAKLALKHMSKEFIL